MSENYIKFHDPSRVDESLYKYAITVSRYGDKWVLCRHRQRAAWEFSGGHREAGESIQEAARRELFEETGAVDFKISEVTAFSAPDGDEISYGMLFYAEIEKFSEIPEGSEMAEIAFFERIPDNVTYPRIQSELFGSVQHWLNLQCNKDELWDLYDGERRPLGRLHRRADFLREGEYHLVVHVWLRNSRGEYLITKRAPNKGFPNMWETTGGSALAGDDSLAAALREVREEIGLSADPARGRVALSFRRDDNFCDVWLFCQDFELSEVVLLEGETTDRAYASPEKVRELYENGQFVPYEYIDKILEGDI